MITMAGSKSCCFTCKTKTGVTKQSNAVTSNEKRSNEKTSYGIKFQEVKKLINKS